jgi:hypothetical protein
MGVLVLVAEPDFLAVGEENERDAEFVGVAAALRFAIGEIDAGLLGLKDCQCPALPVEQDIICTAAAAQRIFEPDALSVGQAPAGVTQQFVNLDPGEGLGRHCTGRTGKGEFEPADNIVSSLNAFSIMTQGYDRNAVVTSRA